MTMHRTERIELAYEIRGDAGDPVVLLHGSLSDSRAWSLVAPALSASLQVLTYDRRGYGASAGPPRIHAVRDDADDLASLLVATEHYPAHLVAHSYAGAVALRLACERPELVRSVAAHEPPLLGLLTGDPDLGAAARAGIDEIGRLRGVIRGGDLESAAREVVDLFSVTPGAWERVRPEVRHAAIEYLRNWSDEFADPEAVTPDLRALGDLLIPVLVTRGAESPEWIHHVARRLVAALRNVTDRTIPEAGHAPHLVTPDRYVGVLQSFLLERVVPTV